MALVYGALDVRYIDGRKWLLLQPFRVYSDEAHAQIEVPAGRITDFNSIPLGLWNLLPPTDYGEAAVVHDELYKTGKLNGVVIDRELADRVHREFARWKGAPEWKIRLMYRGLRLGGWWSWRTYREKEQHGESESV